MVLVVCANSVTAKALAAELSAVPNSFHVLAGGRLGIVAPESALPADIDRRDGIVAVIHGRDWVLVSREIAGATVPVPVGRFTIGDGTVAVMAGPCSVESREQILEIATAAKAAGAVALRGGAFKPRTSPWSFQGLGRTGLELLAEARERTGLAIVTEVMAPDEVPLVGEFADVLQVGSRNVQNFRLLQAVGDSDKPVLLKRGMASTLDEFLGAAEYIVARGNTRVILCERGIRSFEPRLRNTLDLGGVALLKRLTHLPVLVDPSHGSGLSELVPDLARAAVAVGADGLLIETHGVPERALSDGRQSLRLSDLDGVVRSLRVVAEALGRQLAVAAAPTDRRVAEAQAFDRAGEPNS